MFLEVFIDSLELCISLNALYNFHQLMNLRHVLFDLPNLLKSFSAELARQLFLVDFPLFLSVDVFDVSGDVVGVEEAFSANFTSISALASVRFPGNLKGKVRFLKKNLLINSHVSLHFGLRVRSKATNGAHDVLLLLVHKHMLRQRRVPRVALSTDLTNVVFAQ
jgi:hypothetical protein